MLIHSKWEWTLHDTSGESGPLPWQKNIYILPFLVEKKKTGPLPWPKKRRISAQPPPPPHPLSEILAAPNDTF